jgi:hypothetical protein
VDGAVCRIDGVIGVVGRLEADARFLFIEPFQCHVLVVKKGDDETAIIGCRHLFADYVVAVEDAGTSHTVAGDLEGEGVGAGKKRVD